MIRLLVLFGAGLLAASSIASASPGTRADGGAPHAHLTSYPGCCNDPDVLDFGYHVNFNAWGDGDELTDQLRGVGLLFGRAVSPNAPPTMVVTDPSRGSLCQTVLNGEPAFSGWEYFIFVDPVSNQWATVQKVGADIGFADREQICFLAAYDKDGNLLDFRYNDRIGFQFLSIERPTADISRVMIGDCDGPFCYQDGGGSAFNCLTFSGPIATSHPLPAEIGMPRAPILQGVPAMPPLGGILASGALVALGVLVLFRRSRRRSPA